MTDAAIARQLELTLRLPGIIGVPLAVFIFGMGVAAIMVGQAEGQR